MNYKQCEGLTVQSVDDEMLLLDLNKDQIHQLNPTACLIWSQCDGNKSENNLAALLVEKYDIDIETALGDVIKIIQDLHKLELIEPVS